MKVICKDRYNCADMTYYALSIGKEYDIIRKRVINNNLEYFIKNDFGLYFHYPAYMFRNLRKEKLEKLKSV